MFQPRQWNLLIALSIGALAVGTVVQHRTNLLFGFPTTPVHLAYEAGSFLAGAFLLGAVLALIAIGVRLWRGKPIRLLAAFNLGMLLFILLMASLQLMLETSGIEIIRAKAPEQETL